MRSEIVLRLFNVITILIISTVHWSGRHWSQIFVFAVEGFFLKKRNEHKRRSRLNLFQNLMFCPGSVGLYPTQFPLKGNAAVFLSIISQIIKCLFVSMLCLQTAAIFKTPVLFLFTYDIRHYTWKKSQISISLKSRCSDWENVPSWPSDWNIHTNIDHFRRRVALSVACQAHPAVEWDVKASERVQMCSVFILAGFKTCCSFAPRLAICFWVDLLVLYHLFPSNIKNMFL